MARARAAGHVITGRRGGPRSKPDSSFINCLFTPTSKPVSNNSTLYNAGKKKTPLEDYYVSAKLSLTKFDGKTHKLLNLELLVKIRLKMYRCEQSGTNDQGHTAAVERSAVPVSSWLGRGRRSRTPI